MGVVSRPRGGHDAELREHRSAGWAPTRWSTPGRLSDRAPRSGARVHLSGGVGIGGVLEPPQAAPVIIGDDVFVGSRSMVIEGARVGEGAVLGAGTILSPSIPVIDAESGDRARSR